MNKSAEVKPGTSPTLSAPNSEDASLISELLDDNNGNTIEERIEEEESTSSPDNLLEQISSVTLYDAGVNKQEEIAIPAGSGEIFASNSK